MRTELILKGLRPLRSAKFATLLLLWCVETESSLEDESAGKNAEAFDLKYGFNFVDLHINDIVYDTL